MTCSDAQAERIVVVATQLFAELGFDGSSLGLIAEAAGVGTAAINERFGGKNELYRAVMLRAHQAERAALAEAAAAFTPTRRGLGDLIDAYLDYYAANPALVSLWLHRRMGDATDIAEMEELYVRPGFTKLAAALSEVAPGDVDIDFVLWTIPWMVSGFLSSGVMRSAQSDHVENTGPDPHDLAEFRRYLHQVIERMLPLPD
ncbi:TetR/AcrR family transcriptional regulator [Spirillospora sp. CA-294931]|uniref:TetR/AcrR family transcriptional regulator n=1 Tax=Spirillospora sp. CA-294931 TaxID=3240042 RepID=UPI003D93A5A8